jgi:hypothetical protein
MHETRIAQIGDLDIAIRFCNRKTCCASSSNNAGVCYDFVIPDLKQVFGVERAGFGLLRPDSSGASHIFAQSMGKVCRIYAGLSPPPDTICNAKRGSSRISDLAAEE